MGAGVARWRPLALALALAAACSDGVQPAPAPSPPAARTAPRSVLAFADERHLYVSETLADVRRAVPDAKPLALAFSGDGRYVAYVSDDPALSVGVHDLATSETWRWRDERYTARSIGYADGAFVVVNEGAEAAILSFEPGGRTGAAVAPLAGVTNARLLTTNGSRIIVASAAGAAASGGPETVYEVEGDGATTRLFTDGDDRPEGEVRNLAIGPAALMGTGHRLMYATGATAGGCDYTVRVVVRPVSDIPGDVPRPMRPLPGGPRAAVASIVTNPDGHTVVGVTTGTEACPGERPGATAYTRAGARWEKLLDDAVWTGYGTDHRHATLHADGTLSILGKPVAEGVLRAVWSPV